MITEPKNQSDVILQNLLDAVIVLDKEGYIIYLNKAAEALFENQNNTLIGVNFGFPVTPYELQEIQIQRNEKWVTIEMLGTSINWEMNEAFLMSLRDVTEKKKLEKELYTANRQLKEKTKNLKELNASLIQSNESLEQFAHVASHDLKEPLRKIIIFSNRIENDCETHLPDICRTYLHKIENATKRMFSMIEGVLTYSSFSSSEQAIEEVDLNKIINDIETDLEVVIHQKSASIYNEGLPQIEGASVLLYQLFYNLIQNSLKFAKKNENPIITISSKTFSKHSKMLAKIVVKDNGIGFHNHQAEKIFDSFARLHSKDKYDGTGLGLSLCKKIVSRHQGTIHANSLENSGAAFHITLPVKQEGKALRIVK